MKTCLTYDIVNELLSKDEIKEKYGDVSFAYSDQVDDRYQVKAISSMEQQYLRTALLIDKVEFIGVDTVQELEYLNGVI